MKYTKFGEYFRILRIKHKEVLSDVKELLGVSSAFISAVECGKKPIPEKWYDILVTHYKLNNTEQKDLFDAIEMSKKSVSIDIKDASNNQKKVALQFCRSFDDISDETANEILKILERNK